MNRKVLLIGLGITIPVVIILAMGFGRDPHKVDSPLIGKTAPSFALQSVADDQLVSLDQFKGKPVVVNFWATWCVPCLSEHETLKMTAKQMGSNVQFLGVVYDDSKETIHNFMQQYGSAYPTLMDQGGKTAIAYGVYGVPETFFINPEGTIVSKFEGPLSPALLQENLQKAMR